MSGSRSPRSPADTRRIRELSSGGERAALVSTLDARLVLDLQRMDACFPKANRLLRKGEFDRVFATRCSARAGPIVVYASRNDAGLPRLGLVVSRKVGPAVVRNRWKRCLREAFRLEKHRLPQDLDVVILPRGAEPEEVSELRAMLVKTIRRLNRRLK